MCFFLLYFIQFIVNTFISVTVANRNHVYTILLTQFASAIRACIIDLKSSDTLFISCVG